MNEMYIVAFNSTHHAIRTDKVLNEKDIKVTTLPTPREISSSCGISVRFLELDMDTVINSLEENEILYHGIFKVSRLSGGKKEITKLR
ncbi:DUF3343 domain-containing protein [Paraclostridium sordellii]|uniref:DUF3343 domain-containing protein n=1 Tax=Paraclostridium sordellii TaxID=1505 RepID=UPI0030D19F98